MKRNDLKLEMQVVWTKQQNRKQQQFLCVVKAIPPAGKVTVEVIKPLSVSFSVEQSTKGAYPFKRLVSIGQLKPIA